MGLADMARSNEVSEEIKGAGVQTSAVGPAALDETKAGAEADAKGGKQEGCGKDVSKDGEDGKAKAYAEGEENEVAGAIHQARAKAEWKQRLAEHNEWERRAISDSSIDSSSREAFQLTVRAPASPQDTATQLSQECEHPVSSKSFLRP